MPEHSGSSLRGMRQQRERLVSRIELASWCAMGGAALGLLLILWVAAATRQLTAPVVLSTVTSTVSLGLVGYKLQISRSRYVAWGLMAAYLCSAVTTAVAFGLWSGIVMKVILLTIYVRGFFAACDYYDLGVAIDAAEHARDATEVRPSPLLTT